MVSYTLSGKATLYDRLTLKPPSSTTKDIILMTWTECKDGYLATFIDEIKFNIMGQVKAADGTTVLSNVSVGTNPAANKLSYLNAGSNTLDDNMTKTDVSGTFVAKLSNGKYTFTASDGSHSFDPVEITVSEPVIFRILEIKAK